MYKNIWETEWNFTFFLKKEGNCFTFPSLELTYASVFTLTELSGLDWGAVHLDIPKAHFECSPRRTKPARRWRRRNPGDFGRSQWAQVWNRTKDGGETKVSILYPHLYCLDHCISDRLLGCEGGAVSWELDFSQRRQGCLLQLWFLFKPHKSDRHQSIDG